MKARQSGAVPRVEVEAADTSYGFVGDLEAVEVTGLLSMLSGKGHRGYLELMHPGGRTHTLLMEGGLIRAATSSEPYLRLGNLLVNGGAISREECERVLSRAIPGVPCGTALLFAGLISIEDLRRFLDIQARAVLADALEWTAGSFAACGDALPPAEVSLEIRVDYLLLNHATEREERAWLATRMPSKEALLIARPYAESEEELAAVILRTLATPHAAPDLLGAAGVSEIALLRTLADLCDAGLVMTVSP